MNSVKTFMFILMTALWCGQGRAQSAKKLTVVTKPKAYVFPVSALTKRIVFHDTIRVSGGTEEDMRKRFIDGYFKNFAFAD